MKQTAIALAIALGTSTAAFAVDPAADAPMKKDPAAAAGASVDATTTTTTPAVPAIPAEPAKPAASTTDDMKTKPYGKSDKQDKTMPSQSEHGERNRGAASENNTTPGSYGERSRGEPAQNNTTPTR